MRLLRSPSFWAFLRRVFFLHSCTGATPIPFSLEVGGKETTGGLGQRRQSRKDTGLSQRELHSSGEAVRSRDLLTVVLRNPQTQMAP